MILLDEVQGGETLHDERCGGGGGWGGEENVMEVLLNKFIWMRKILIMIIVMFHVTITKPCRPHFLEDLNP